MTKGGGGTVGLAPWTKGKHLSEEHKKKLSESKKGRYGHCTKSVSQYTLDGKFVATYNSVQSAIKAVNGSCYGFHKSINNNLTYKNHF